MVCVGARERGDVKMFLFYLLPDGGGWARHNQSTVAEPLERAVPMIMRCLSHVGRFLCLPCLLLTSWGILVKLVICVVPGH